MTLILDYLEDKNMSDFDAAMNARADELIARPLKHITINSGKQFRIKFINVLHTWFPVDQPILNSCKVMMKMMHNISLLIDDVQDRSTLRRGYPTAHTIYGVPHTLLCGSYSLFAAPRDPYQISLMPYIRTGLKGQIMETYWRDVFQCPTMEEYLDMTTKKTSFMFQLCIDALLFSYHTTENFTDIAYMLGQYFQIRDDYLNLASEQFQDNKGFCDDLTEGKFSFPIVYYINNYPEDDRILNILKQRTKDVKEKKKVLEILTEHNVFDVTLKTVERLKQNLISRISEIGGNDEMIALLDNELY